MLLLESELMWAAGFFDGEGCVSIHTVTEDRIRNGKRYGPYQYTQYHLDLPQVNREPLDRFVKAVGRGKVYGPYTTPRQPQYRIIYASKEDVRSVANLLLPYVCSVKGRQLEAAIRRIDSGGDNANQS